VKVSQKHIALIRTLYAPAANATDQKMVANAIGRMDEAEQQQFAEFQKAAGDAFIALQEDLDSELERLADQFPDEPDPRKWKLADWVTFDLAVFGHEYEELWRTYASQKPNTHLVWEKVLERLGKE
jgi:hypothetical protein